MMNAATKRIKIVHASTESDEPPQKKTKLDMSVQLQTLIKQNAELMELVETQRKVIGCLGRSLQAKRISIARYRRKLNKYTRRESRQHKSVEKKVKKQVRDDPLKVPVDSCYAEANSIINELSMCQSKHHSLPYADVLKDFSYKLHFNSPRAYKILRSKMQTLPHPRTFQNWTRNVKSSPGFLPSAFAFIQKRVKESSASYFML